MNYLKQFSIILCFSFAGELLSRIIPVPVPAAVWGIVLLFLGLATHLVPLSAVRDAGTFLTKIMPVLFVAPAVDLMDCWDLVRDNWIGIALVVVLSTVITFAVSGRICQGLIRKEDEHHG